MSKREDYESKTEALIIPILEENNFELWDVEYVKEGSDYYLRCYIDKEGGITIDDCVTVSRALSDKLDENDYIDDAYILEVSSPGLGRQLKKDKDFEKCIGREVEVKTYRMKDKKKDFEGQLKAYDKNTITISTETNEEIVFDRSEVALIKLKLDI